MKPDIVFSYFSKPVIFATLAARLARVPRVVGMLEGLGYTFTRGVTKRERVKKFFIRFVQVQLYRLAFPFLDRIIFLNSDDLVDLVQKHRIRVKNIQILGGIGVDLKAFTYMQPLMHPVRFIFVGRLLTEKGIWEFIDAAKAVKQKFPDTEFVALGMLDSGNPASLAEKELQDLKTQDIVLLPGHVSDVKQWLQNSSVFVHPSCYREGMPRSTQEAMATGRAVITTDVPGCRQTVVHGENGFLIPARNADALAEKMIFFISNREPIITMGLNSRDKAEKMFCVKLQTERLAHMITDC